MPSQKTDKKILSKAYLFWDVKIKLSDIEKYKKFIIERILERGDLEDYLWAVASFGRKEIVKNILSAKTLNKKSLNFWCLIFKIDKKKCILNQSIKKRELFWKR